MTSRVFNFLFLIKHFSNHNHERSTYIPKFEIPNAPKPDLSLSSLHRPVLKTWPMSATEKLFVKIFERKKQFVEQVRQESLLWEDNLRYLLILNGIPPPPWLNNSAVHSSFPSDPKGTLSISLTLFTPSQKLGFIVYERENCAIFSF